MIRPLQLRPRRALLLALVLCGCSSPERGGEAPVADLPALPAAAVRPDPGVEQSLETRIHDVSRREDGRLVVDLHLTWQGSRPERLLWFVEWLDRDGARVPDPAAGWRTLDVRPGVGARLELLAPAPEAESWRLRFARPGD